MEPGSTRAGAGRLRAARCRPRRSRRGIDRRRLDSVRPGGLLGDRRRIRGLLERHGRGNHRMAGRRRPGLALRGGRAGVGPARRIARTPPLRDPSRLRHALGPGRARVLRADRAGRARGRSGLLDPPGRAARFHPGGRGALERMDVGRAGARGGGQADHGLDRRGPASPLRVPRPCRASFRARDRRRGAREIGCLGTPRPLGAGRGARAPHGGRDSARRCRAITPGSRLGARQDRRCAQAPDRGPGSRVGAARLCHRRNDHRRAARPCARRKRAARRWGGPP
jgi:hypothetical protein